MGQTFVYNAGAPVVPDGDLHLEFGMFFDGTLNNMYNTELRERYRDKGNRIRPKSDYTYKSDGSKISDDSYKKIVEENEKAIKATRDAQEAEYDKLGNKDPDPNDSEYVRYLKSCHREPLKPGERKFGMDELGVDNSFSNDYTNVARMYKCCDEEYAIYIEGIGTIGGKDEKGNEKVGRDVDDGFQYGSGFSGVRGKVRRGCEMLAEKIFSAKKNIDKTKKLSQITIDVSGFSRGAAAARNFVYEVNNHSKRPEDLAIKSKRMQDGFTIKKISPNYGNDFQTERYVPKYKTIYQDKDKIELDPRYLDNGKMPRFGYLGYYLLRKGVLKLEELDSVSLVIRFIGVYDTVSSYEEFGDMNFAKRAAVGSVHATLGAEHHFGDDVEQLQLNNLGSFAEAVHFTAMDEHRENFALTRFVGSKEFNFPGVHCDIGGAYETGTEIVDEIETANIGLAPTVLSSVSISSNLKLEMRKQHLIDEHWYKEEELDISVEKHSLYTPGAYRKLTGTRFLKKEYSYITLHFMEELGSKHMKHKMISGAYPTTTYPINDSILRQAKTHLKKYVDGKEREWLFISDEELKRIKRKKAEQEKFDKEMTDIMNGKMKNKEPVYDNLDPNKYLPKTIPILIDTVPPISEILIDGKKEKVTVIEEVTVIGYTNQGLLRKLRNEYLHWSANRDWLGMDPTDDYKRVEH
ncbi:phospholipase effector Tle1 domain-containing protein [Chryseobacterium sp. YIM B08800]|uniref:phospholipase effector Tle1 domain-containing protein n=1 Tax=Chryseobacterium sp. YIM B08800 TaxID=2984136 RepID=UPI00223FAF9E|nr:DUF2235 domain-containing protein [Chryseobacterium sp. YIM B08800]